MNFKRFYLMDLIEFVVCQVRLSLPSLTVIERSGVEICVQHGATVQCRHLNVFVALFCIPLGAMYVGIMRAGSVPMLRMLGSENCAPWGFLEWFSTMVLWCLKLKLLKSNMNCKNLNVEMFVSNLSVCYFCIVEGMNAKEGTLFLTTQQQHCWNLHKQIWMFPPKACELPNRSLPGRNPEGHRCAAYHTGNSIGQHQPLVLFARLWGKSMLPSRRGGVTSWEDLTWLMLVDVGWCWLMVSQFHVDFCPAPSIWHAI